MPISRDRILFEDEHLLAVHKLAGELTVRGSSLRRGYGRQEGERGKLPLYDFLHQDYPGLRVLHRLDFDTSGVLLFAKTKAAGEAVLASHFKGWKKVYRAIVSGVIDRDRGVIRALLPARGKFGKRNAEFGIDLKKNSSFRTPNSELIPAITHFEVLKRFHGATYVECEIETGRHHQIRRHFAAIKHALALDEIYGELKYNKAFGRATGFRKFFLHAASLTLPHPISGETIHVEAALPKVFEAVLKKLQS
ncbi:MAG: RluA family pseudouridine synthase [Patescibacteria group bacterium]